MPNDPFDITGRVAIITGGSRGLGRAMALGFGARGAKVVVASRTKEANDAVVEEIRTAGGEATSAVVDMSDMDQLDGVVNTAVDEFGSIDILDHIVAVPHLRSDRAGARGALPGERRILVRDRNRAAHRRWHALLVATDAPHAASDRRSDAAAAGIAAAALFLAVGLLGWWVSNHPDPSRVDAAGSRVIGSRRLAASLARRHLRRLDPPHFFDRRVLLGPADRVA